jgi:very-short-patch-repair endonuclease
MTEFFNRSDKMAMRRRLRNEMPRSEVLLWARLRNRQVLGLKFRRQYGVGPYCLDFFCPERKLAVEIDGDSHFTPEAKHADARRQRYLESFGIRIMRYTNEEIRTSLDGVVEAIAGSSPMTSSAAPPMDVEVVDGVGIEEPPCIPPS